MKYNILGRTGVKVSSLCCGTMTFAREADEETSKAMFRRCREAGINFFDTANVYGNGHSEEILGKCIADCRDQIIISSKVGHPIGKDINEGGLSRRHIILAVEESLKRLGTDHLDFYFIHEFDSETHMEEILYALDDLRHQGKILYAGVSNWAAWQIAVALGISERKGLTRFECIQPMYNLVKRQAEIEILPLAESEKLGIITYSPLGAGLLTGKYKSNKKLKEGKEGRILKDKRYTLRYGEPVYYEIAERFVNYAKVHDVHPVTLAVSWVMSHPAVTASLIGARNLEQLEISLAAADLKMTPKWREEISALSVTPPPATDRSEGVDFEKKL
jgi:aryl-alcohol dehydrogenase-like predicted oxidoreductase